MTAPAISIHRTIPSVIQEKCQYCSRFHHPRALMHFGQSMAICMTCYQNHNQALKLLCQGTPPPGCQECAVPFSDLTEDGHGNKRMYAHAKDGIYQILCPKCSDAYVLKRRDLYGATQFGRQKGL